MRSLKLLNFMLISAIAVACGIGGCYKAPNKDDQSKLEEAKAAAESAEKKLYETRQERMRLEAQKGTKQDEDKKSDDK